MATTLNQAAQSAQRLDPRPFHREEGEKKHRIARHRTGDDRTGRGTDHAAVVSERAGKLRGPLQPLGPQPRTHQGTCVHEHQLPEDLWTAE